ncbi:MAG TPA: SigE family RNA polymerase sigma factor [Acidimicrobiia bacterium]|nr:SigE family RNA polymerase sigma factor [Acidimicrobiia bacterium]
MTTTEAGDVLATTAPAFEDFYRTAWAGAVRLAALLTQDARAAEDLAQEAFTRIYPKWARVEQPQAYLRTAIVNACRSWQSRRHTERSKLPLLATREASELGFDALADVVAALPYRQRAVLVLRYHSDLSEAEIADALGCRRGTVKSLASRALANLRKGIEE